MVTAKRQPNKREPNHDHQTRSARSAALPLAEVLAVALAAVPLEVASGAAFVPAYRTGVALLLLAPRAPSGSRPADSGILALASSARSTLHHLSRFLLLLMAQVGRGDEHLLVKNAPLARSFRRTGRIRILLQDVPHRTSHARVGLAEPVEARLGGDLRHRQVRIFGQRKPAENLRGNFEPVRDPKGIAVLWPALGTEP